MNDRYLNLPMLFWQRLLVIGAAFVGAYVGKNRLPVPPFVDDSLVFAVTFILILLVGFITLKTVKSSFLSYVIVQLMFFWMLTDKFLLKTIHLSYKPHALVFGFTIFAGTIFFLKYYKFIWRFNAFKLLFFFFIINIFYFFLYSSDFNISQAGIVYDWKGGAENQPANTIVFLNSVAVLFSSIVALGLFKEVDTKEKIDKLFSKLMLVYAVAFTSLILIIPALETIKGSGHQVYFSIYFILMLGIKYYIDNNLVIPDKLNTYLITILLILAGFSIAASNKTAIAAFLFTVLFFVLLNYKLGIKFNIFSFLNNKRFGLWFYLAGAVIVLAIAAKFNLIDTVFDKISKIVNATQSEGITSLSIRKSNWKYFLEYWASSLDFFKIIFGYGLGKSREVIFYISGMQYSPIYLVQTTHNQFMEMFFDYGLMAFFFYGSFIVICINNLKNLICKAVDKNIKLLSNVSLSLIIFFAIYHVTDGLRVPTGMILFSALMFLEGAKYVLQKDIAKT